MNIQESGEMYLETILVLKKSGINVRSIDIADKLGYSKPSVSRAVRILKENGYISVDSGGIITLLPSGEAIAERTYERHRILTELFIRIGVDAATAAEDACRIEHVISEATFAAIKGHISERSLTKE